MAPRPASSPVGRVKVMQALVARELVEGFGLPGREAARLLGIVPSSVSQYLTGKRLAPTWGEFQNDEKARRLARRAAQALLADAPTARVLLEAAIELEEGALPRAPEQRSLSAGGTLRASLQREVPRWLRKRIAGEQAAVAECMKLAQRSRDELTRALFRQIASDSLRHAEIVASLAAYLDRGISSSEPTGITPEDVDHLIESEHAAEASNKVDLGPDLGGVMRILWESMEADERKHELLLQRLRAAHGLARPRSGRRLRSRRRAPRP